MKECRTFVLKWQCLEKALSTTLSIDVENYLKKINKKDLTNPNQLGLSIFFIPPKKLAQKFYWSLNTVFIIFYGKNRQEFINFAGCLHLVNNVTKALKHSN